MKCYQCHHKMDKQTVRTRICIRHEYICPRCGYIDFEFEKIVTSVIGTKQPGKISNMTVLPITYRYGKRKAEGE